MERDQGQLQEARAIAAGKRLDWPLLPIQDRDQRASPVEGVAAGVQHSPKTENEEKDTVPEVTRGTEKTRQSTETVLTEQPRQSPTDPTVPVAGEASGSGQDHQARGTATTGAVHSGASVNIPTNEDSAVWGVNTAMRTQRTFELAGRVGKKPVSVLLDSGSTGNFVGT